MKNKPRKPLNQAEFKMRIVKDLGVVTRDNLAKPTRMAIFECSDCMEHSEKIVKNAKKSEYCPSCSKKHADAKKTKPLIQSDFKMKIIKDLGKTTANDESTNLARYAIFECTDCKIHFKARASGKRAKEQIKCDACAKRKDRMYDHQLYPVWNGIKQRCYSAKRKDYQRYGAIGVTMCDEWKDDPANFILWCEANGWEPGLEIDKDIKCRENKISPAIYSPETITFVTSSQNTREANGRPVKQYDLYGKYISTFKSAIDAGESMGLKSGDSITNTCKSRQHTSAGFKWAYADIDNN